ncbi:MAG: hypothetical protein Q9181_006807 [Wetmoreana brouardii]
MSSAYANCKIKIKVNELLFEAVKHVDKGTFKLQDRIDRSYKRLGQIGQDVTEVHEKQAATDFAVEQLASKNDVTMLCEAMKEQFNELRIQMEKHKENAVPLPPNQPVHPHHPMPPPVPIASKPALRSLNSTTNLDLSLAEHF